MINPIFRAATVLVMTALTSMAMAGQAVDKAIADKLRAVLANPEMGLEVDTVEVSPIPGLYAVEYASGPVVYASANGDYMILGDLYSVDDKGYTNLTAKRRDGERLEALAKVEEKDMIIFAAEIGRAHV